MFIPLKDSTLHIHLPFITVGLIFINIVIYLYQSSLSPVDQRTWICTTGVVADQLFDHGIIGFISPFFTLLFIHGGFLAGISLLFTLEPYERKRRWKRLNQNY